MEIGICTAPPEAELATALSSAGCAYYEPPVASAVMAPGPEEFDASLASWAAGPLRPRSANVLLPGDLKIVGEHVDTQAVDAYLAEACRRAELLGVEVLVFGSGAARCAPDGFPPQEARRQFADALRLAAGHAAPGTVIAAEHLCRAETNVVNSFAEAAALVRGIGADRLALVADGYHLGEEGEDAGVVRGAASLLRHVHVCGPGRRAPAPGDEKSLLPLLGALADIGYTGRCSIECRWADLAAEGPRAVETVRRAADEAGLA